MAEAHELARLREDKEYLELKLKYVQSVSTIFRQKVAVLLRDSRSGTSRLAQQHAEAEAEGSDMADSVDAVRAMMSEMDSAMQNSPPRGGGGDTAAKSLVSTDRGDYWRERFLRAMEETRPTNLQEAQTLCSLLQERNEISEREAALQTQLTAANAELAKLRETHLRMLDDRAMTADDAVVARFRQKEAELLALSPGGKPLAMEQAEHWRATAQSLETKNKVLRLRNAQLAKEVENNRQAVVESHDEHRSNEADLSCAVNELRAQAAARDADARRAEAGRIKAEQTVMLKDSTISRLEARIAALEKEVTAALKEGTGSLDTNEGAILRRQIDTFELKLRECEEEIRKRDSAITDLERQADILRETIDAKQLQIDAKQRLVDTYAKRLEAQSIDGAQREQHHAMIQSFEQRMSAAVADVVARQNPTELQIKVAELQRQVDTLVAQRKSLEATETDLKRKTEALAAYREELARCVKLGRVPTVDVLENEIVKNELRSVKDGGDGHRAGLGEVVLRAEGGWKELRDVASGMTFYVTTEAKNTPFKPVNIREPKKTPAPAASTSAASTPARGPSKVASPDPSAQRPVSPPAGASSPASAAGSTAATPAPGDAASSSAAPPANADSSSASAPAADSTPARSTTGSRAPDAADTASLNASGTGEPASAATTSTAPPPDDAGGKPTTEEGSPTTGASPGSPDSTDGDLPEFSP